MIINEQDLQKVQLDKTLWGANSDLYHCEYQNIKYLYKKLYSFSDELQSKLQALMKNQNASLNLPQYIVFDKGKPTGYLLKPLVNYKLFYHLSDHKREEIIKLLKLAKKSIISMHQDGIIHCDLHPANIMYHENNDDIKIIDFDRCSYNGISSDIKNDNFLCNYYLSNHKLDMSFDIFLFNLSAISLLYKIAYDDILKPNFINVTNQKIENKKQEEIWQKIKQKKELTHNDFFIDYC